MASIDKIKLVKFLGMIGSDQDGEALNAARLANKMVRNAGLTWREVFNAPHEETRAKTNSKEDTKRTNGSGHRTKSDGEFWKRAKEKARTNSASRQCDEDDVEFCSQFAQYLTSREQEFIEGLPEWLDNHTNLTPKQRQWLDTIVEKLKRYGCS